MTKRTKTSIYLWNCVSVIIFLILWPIGIYPMIQSIKMHNSYKIGDNERVEECIRKIKITAIVFGCIILTLFILGVMGIL